MNYTSPTINQSGFLGISSYVAEATNGMFWLMILIVLWVVTFTNTKQFLTSRAFTLASFLCAILSIILSVLNLISSYWAYMFILFTAIGAIWIKFED